MIWKWFFFLFYKIGKLYYKNKETLSNNNKFFYADVLNKFISFKLDDKYADKDKIKLRITDGFFSIFALYEIRRINTVKHLNEIKPNGIALFTEFFVKRLQILIRLY